MSAGSGAWILLLAVWMSLWAGGLCAWGTEVSDEDLKEPDSLEEEEVQEVIDELFKALEMMPEEMAQEEIEEAEVVDIMPEPILSDAGFEYRLPNGDRFVSSVPNGMVTGEPVDFSPPRNGFSLVRIDGGEPFLQEQERFAKPGSYEIQTVCYYPVSGQEIDNRVYENHYYFTILEPATSRIGVVQAPDGFVINGVRRNGKMQNVNNQRYVFLHGDGTFEIDYEDEKTGEMKLYTRLVRDTTAPFLGFDKELKNGRAEAPLFFKPSEPDCVVKVSYNGISGYAAGDTLTVPGSYELSVTDRAGNSRTYLVRLEQTYELFDKRVVIIAVVVLIGIAAWMVVLRRSMRVL